jgi:Tol biopolymer transport system component
VRLDGRVVRTLRALGRRVDAVATSPSARELAYLARRGRNDFPSWTVATVRVRGGPSRELLRVDRFGIVSSPVWSRDGSKVTVTTTRELNDTDLFTMRADGGDIRRVTDDAVAELYPAVSRSGRLVFAAPTRSAIPQLGLFTITRRGGAPKGLTRPPLGADDIYPSWSRDERTLAFVRNFAPSGLDDGELWTIRADGTNARRLFVSDRELMGTTWSPDGSQVAFGRFDLHRPAIWAVGADGRAPHELTGRGGVAAPAWSPDGSRLAFVVAGTLTLAVLDLASGAVTEVAEDAAGGISPAWSPDGTRLAYVGDDNHVHTVAAAGGDERDLTSGPGREWGVAWSRSSG